MTEADIDAVAHRVLAQVLRAKTPVSINKKEQQVAERLHRHGAPARGIPACDGLHGTNGEMPGRAATSDRTI